MSPVKTRLLGAAALIVALGAGFGLARLTTPPPAPVKAVEAPAQDEAEAEEGVVRLTSAQIAAAGIAIEPVGRGGGSEVLLSGRVEAMPDARAPVTSIVEGRIVRILVAPGQAVRAGQPVAILLSADAATLRAEADAASAAATAARAAYQRENTLHGQGWVATQRLDATRAQMLSAEAAARAAGARASAAGAPDAQGRFRLTSPIGGVVVNLPAASGGFVTQGSLIAEIADPARVELVFQAPAVHGGEIGPGAVIQVRGPGGAFEATVVGVSANAGQNGAAVIRARARGGALPPAGSAVSGSLATDAAPAGVTVPSDAVQTVEGRSVVFVATPQGFRAVPVLVGRTAAGRSEILGGLTGPERIAAANAFLLKAELAKGEGGHGH